MSKKMGMQHSIALSLQIKKVSKILMQWKVLIVVASAEIL